MPTATVPGASARRMGLSDFVPGLLKGWLPTRLATEPAKSDPALEVEADVTEGAVDAVLETTTIPVPTVDLPAQQKIIPSKDPRAVHPDRQSRVVSMSALSVEQVQGAARSHLVDVLRATAPVLSGAAPDGFIRPFALPGPSQVAKIFTQALARQIVKAEQRPQVIIGYGTIGGIFASGITEALLELHCPVDFLPVERNARSQAEGYGFLCPEGEIQNLLRGRRVLLALPILTAKHIEEIAAIRALVDSEQCAAQCTMLATIVQYGTLPVSLGDFRVETLLQVHA